MVPIRSQSQPTPPSLLKKGGAGRILALDFGLKRIGVAVADADLQMAFPQEPIPFVNMRQAVLATAALIATNGITAVIIGLPLNMSGQGTEQTEVTQDFITALKKACGIPVHVVDERLTTKIAQERMRAQGLSEKERRLLKDSVSAVVMLEAWLEK